MSLPKDLSWKNPPQSQSWVGGLPNDTLKTDHILKEFFIYYWSKNVSCVLLRPCCFSCNSGFNSILSLDAPEMPRNSWWEQHEVPAALPSSRSTVLGTTTTHVGCVSNGKVKLIRLAETMRKKLKEEFQCEVLVKETADPSPSYLSLLQTPHFTLTLLHCPSMVPLWKAYLISKYTLDSSFLPQQHIAPKYS